MTQNNDLKNKKFLKFGLWLFLIGSGPLIVTGLLDPDSNPVGFGIMAFLTFWPSIIIMLIGLFKIFKAKKSKNNTTG